MPQNVSDAVAVVVVFSICLPQALELIFICISGRWFRLYGCIYSEKTVERTGTFYILQRRQSPFFNRLRDNLRYGCKAH